MDLNSWPDKRTYRKLKYVQEQIENQLNITVREKLGLTGKMSVHRPQVTQYAAQWDIQNLESTTNRTR
jgi:sensor domain CHASE-containing protein